MAHYRKAVGMAVAVNTGISVVEAIAGFQAHSLSLITDSAHNLSDEMAMVALWLAFFVPHGPSRGLLRTANLFNSLGLIVISGVLVWQAVDRLLHPIAVPGLVPIIVGCAASLANAAVARLLFAPGKQNATIRLAYIHNLGDVWVSLAPVVAGALVLITSRSVFDPLVAAGVALWLVISTAREVLQSGEELVWPKQILCCHTDEEIAH